MNLEIFVEVCAEADALLHIIWQIFDNIYVFICSSWF